MHFNGTNARSPRRRVTAFVVAGATALGLAVIGVPAPGSAVTPGQGYQPVRQFVVDGDNDIAVNATTGDVYVTDSVFERVKRYSPSGALLASVDVAEADGIDVGPQGHLYLADEDGVTVFTPDLSQRAYFPVENIGVTDVAVNPTTGDVYVTDVVDDEVIRYSATGTFLGRWGGPGSGDGQLDNPQSIAVAPGGDVYVGERWNNRVSRFSATGVFLGKWGQLGTTPGSFHWPRGLATDSQGNVYVADYADGAAQGGRVQVFTGAGGYLTSIGAFNAAPFGSFGPRDVDVDAAGRVHVIAHAPSLGNAVTTFAPFVPAAGTGTATVVKPNGALKLQGKRIRITVKCATAAACTGVATVTVKGTSITKPKGYSIPAGKKKVITVKATKKGLKVLRKKAVTKALVTVHGGQRMVKIRR
ncbi:NHL repeat-containing protein [Nocardioides kongjuensis]|uniref:Sugar lactone lactonase YvrE n=1 Tax=Nocardioides kongjuensis TaxID=349522 RepID=A0A852RH15_9ACTN|nr:NHL repeat-containing protein [Nocardioides kongjuensis]NYD32667.1 sugar lactone lactonase YvrE [Nocardioides kongjuensis]